MFATQIGYNFPELNMTPRIYLGLDYASGDDSGSDLGTFNQLFPLGHAYLGFTDTIGRQNIIDVSTGIRIVPTTSFTFSASIHNFWRASDDDAVYNAGGGVVRSAPSVDSLRIGTELDLTLQYAMSRNTNVLIGFSHFIAEDLIEKSGAADDMNFLYIQTQFTF